jgi:hypothetical protein
VAARYALQSFTVQLSGGVSHTVVLGSHRDSTHAAVVAAPGLFTTTPLAVPQIDPKLAAYLAAYPDGPQVS